MKKALKSKGFTLAELVIVLVIIGIIFAIGAPSISGFAANSQARNCNALTRNMFSELKNLIIAGRIDSSDIDFTEELLNEKIKATVERYTMSSETVITESSGYRIETNKLCGKGTHTVSWSYSTAAEDDSSVSVTARIECSCSEHESEDFKYNSDIIFTKPEPEGGGGGSGGGNASGEYGEVMEYFSNLITDNWTKLSTGQMKNTVNKIAKMVSEDPYLSKYFTEQQVLDFIDSGLYDSKKSISRYQILNLLLGDYLFDTVFSPTLTVTNGDGASQTFNVFVRIEGNAFGKFDQYVFFVNENGRGQNDYSNWAKYLCYRDKNGEKWYMYTGSGQLNLPRKYDGAALDTQAAVNSYIDAHPELFVRVA